MTETSSSTPKKTIGILTGGGDCPGLNAVIRAVVKSATIKYGWRVIGIRDGFDGLIFPDRMMELTRKEISGILIRGGTILGTSNRGNPFCYPIEENGATVEKDVSPLLIENFKKSGLDALVITGGDGTMKIGLELFKRGIPVVGVPKTIDNDLSATEVTFGFDTAVRTATEAIDKLHSTAESHHRVMLVEVMGRDAGWIALHAGMASGAHIILLSEIPFTLSGIVKKIREREAIGRRYSIIVVAEGCRMIDGRPLNEALKERRLTPRSGEAANAIGAVIRQETGRETRVTVLGHIQRGGTPTPFDRVLSSRMGAEAVELIARGDYGRMVCLHANTITSALIEEAVGVLKVVDPNSELVRAARALDISFGD